MLSVMQEVIPMRRIYGSGDPDLLQRIIDIPYSGHSGAGAGLFGFEKCDMVIRSGKFHSYMVE